MVQTTQHDLGQEFRARARGERQCLQFVRKGRLEEGAILRESLAPIRRAFFLYGTEASHQGSSLLLALRTNLVYHPRVKNRSVSSADLPCNAAMFRSIRYQQ